MQKFKEGQLVAYCPKDVDGNIYDVQIGKVKRIDEKHKRAFVYYHAGDTAAGTPLQYLHEISNAHTIKETTLATVE